MSLKHVTLESHLKEVTEVKGLWNIWEQAKIDIPKALSQLPFGFPNFSMHDESHSKKIIETIELLLGEKGVEALSAIDTFMLLMAAYSHDLGMYLSYKRLIVKEKPPYTAFRSRFSQIIAKLLPQVFNHLCEVPKTCSLHFTQSVKCVIICLS